MKYKVSSTGELKAIIAAKFNNRLLPEKSKFIHFTDIPLNDLDVSEITDMSYLFLNCFDFNEDINEWDVSQVRNMDGMFQGCSKFNKPLDKWDTCNVQTLELIFYSAYDFNQNINNWDVSQVEDTRYAFYNAKNFNQPLDNWDVSSVLYMNEMFNGCLSFNQDLTSWNLNTNVLFSDCFNNCISLDFKNIYELFKDCDQLHFAETFDYDFIKAFDKAQLLYLIKAFGVVNNFNLKAFKHFKKEDLLDFIRDRYSY